MSLLQIILTILAVIFSLVIIFLIWLFGVLQGKNWSKDNPEKCLVFIDGISKPFKGKRTEVSKRGSVYQYGKKLNQIVLFPSTFKLKYHYHRVIIEIHKQGQLIASPQSDDTVNLSDSERENIIYELTTGHLVADALRAFSSRFDMGGMIIVIIVVLIVGLAGGFLVNKVMTRTPVTQTINTANSTPTITPIKNP